MPVNNALTPEGSNALGAAFGYYPQLRRTRQFNDREASAEMPLQALRGRLATTFGAPSDILNTFRSPMPMEMYGQTDYAPQQQVPYGSQELMQTLPLPPQGPAQQMAGNIGALAPLSPAEILQTARLARKAAMAGGATAKQAGRLVGEELNAAMLGERPNTLLGAITPKPMFAVEPNTNLLAQSVIKPKAEVSPLGFYSAVEQQSLNIPRKQGTGVSFLNDLSKGQDVKKYEIEAMGLEDFLKNKPNVTRQEVQDFIQNNKINVEERQLGGTITEDPIGIAKRKEVFDKYDPQIQAMYKEMDNPTYKLVDRQVGPEEYQRGVILQNRVYRGEEITAQEQAQLNSIMNRINGVAIKEFPNVEEARKFYLGMSSDDKFRHSIMPLNSSTELQQKINQLQHIRDTEANAAYVVPEPTPTKYEKYQLPGGENYREILLKLPPTENVVQQWMVYRPNGASIGGYSSEEYAKRAAQEVGGTYKQGESLRGEAGYRSSHWSDPNVLAHMRVNDRVDAQGKKMLLIEEVQSDWHQAGREKGYASPADKKALQNELNNVAKERNDLVAELSKYEQQNGFLSLEMQQRWDKFKEKEDLLKQRNKDFSSQPPDAPFKDTWHQLALKRAIKEAVDKGYDRIGLTTGKQQAERYDLSRQISRVVYSPETEMLNAFDNSNRSVLQQSGIKPDQIENYIGKEPAKKLFEQQNTKLDRRGGKDVPYQEINGVDLQVGGEGMKKYYDEVYPNFLNKFGKKYGAQVGETYINANAKTQTKDQLAKELFGNTETYKNLPSEQKRKVDVMFMDMSKEEKIRYLDITPEMRKAVKAGQPLASITNNLANAMA